MDTADCEGIPFVPGVTGGGDGSGFIAVEAEAVGGIVVFGGAGPDTSINIASGAFVAVVIAGPNEVVGIGAPVEVTCGASIIYRSVEIFEFAVVTTSR